MPNHVKNIVKMSCICDLPLFVSEFENGKEIKCFDFNKIIQMPKELNVESGGREDISIIYFLTERCTIPLECLESKKRDIVSKVIDPMFHRSNWAEEVFRRAMVDAYSNSASHRDKLYESGRVYISNYEKYGYTSWYEWCRNTWGTKWNAYSNDRISNDIISFETAWNSPDPVISKLSEMYPSAEIEHWYADEDMGYNTGYRRYYNGVLQEYIEYEGASSIAFETYIKCWGESECLYKDEDGNWKKKQCDGCDGCRDTLNL